MKDCPEVAVHSARSGWPCSANLNTDLLAARRLAASLQCRSAPCYYVTGMGGWHMRPGRLSLVLLLLTALLFLFPQIRQPVTEGIRSSIGRSDVPIPTPAELERVAREHPEDNVIWLGVAQTHNARLALASSLPETIGQASPASATDAYEKALELDPQSPVVHLRFALYHLAWAGELNRKEEVGFQGRESRRSSAEAKHLEAAQELLRECRPLAPDNAACDYWLAWTLFAEREDEEAFTILEEAYQKQGWSTYHGEVVAAMLRVYDEIGSASALETTSAVSFAAGASFPLDAKVRSLARLLAGLGDDSRVHGEHEQAIQCFRSCAHLGHVMRINATELIDGLLAIAASQIASGAFVSEADRAEVEGLTAEQRRERLEELRLSRFGSYLRRHGHGDLAAWYASDIEEARTWRADAKRVPNLIMDHFVSGIVGSGVLYAAALGVALLGLLGMASLAWVVSLIARYWREPSTPPTWGYAHWVLLLLACVAPGQAAAFFATRSVVGSVASPSSSSFVVGAMLGVVLWFALVLVAALARRRGQPSDTRPSQTRAALGGLRALVLPTLAALLLLLVLSTVPVSRGLQRFDQEEREMMIQGEVQYWGVGTGDVGPHPGVR
jgi:tetratricopeptide (TPR) repeat protein